MGEKNHCWEVLQGPKRRRERRKGSDPRGIQDREGAHEQGGLGLPEGSGMGEGLKIYPMKQGEAQTRGVRFFLSLEILVFGDHLNY